MLLGGDERSDRTGTTTCRAVDAGRRVGGFARGEARGVEERVFTKGRGTTDRPPSGRGVRDCAGSCFGRTWIFTAARFDRSAWRSVLTTDSALIGTRGLAGVGVFGGENDIEERNERAWSPRA